jgi:glycine cleavage system H protein
VSVDYLEVTYDKFVFRVMKRFFYHLEECWAKEEGGLILVGVTDFLQKTVGDVAFLELPEAGTEVTRDGYAGTMETIKTTVMLISPVGGRIKEVNGGLDDNPQLVNTDPYGEGWLFKVAPSDWEGDKKVLLDAQTYLPKMEEKIKIEMAKK